MERISATDAARNFSDLLNRVRYQGKSFEVARGSEVVAKIVPATPPQTVKVADLDTLLAELPRLDPKDAARFEEDLEAIRREATVPEPKWD
jgi:antitoxin (DNA-binding transcriptional repressor) of toxin-antitoxin stability system